MPKPLSKDLLLSRGSCCGNGCENCPYFPRAKKGSSTVFVIPESVDCYPSCSLKTMQEGLCMCYLNFIEEKNPDSGTFS